MRLTRLSVVFTAALAVSFTACPPVQPGPDGGQTPEGVIPPEANLCAGGCDSNQKCDPARRTCVDACAPLASSIKAGDLEVSGNWVKGTPSGVAIQGDLFNGGDCNSALGEAATGRIVLCARGGGSFTAKVRAVADSGGKAVVIFNNEDVSLLGFVEPAASIPALTVSKSYGDALLNEVDQPIIFTARPPNETPVGCATGYCVPEGDAFVCRASATSCNGQVCEPGQVACVAGECSCLSSLSGASDTCQGVGKWCNGKSCVNPKAWEECDVANLTATCGTGETCRELFGDSAFCIRQCQSTSNCDRGDFCIPSFGCVPLPIVVGSEAGCEQSVSDNDGGFTSERLAVPIANTCLLKSSNDGENVTVTDAAGKGTGNCTYHIIKFWEDGVYPYPVCRPPGTAVEGAACRTDYGQTTTATQCGTGLQCVPTKGGDEGVCLRVCNAQPEAYGYDPTPSCNADEACVNTLRYTDPNSNSVLGVCMKTCDVFSADAGARNCANVGASPTSCVPMQASGELPVSLDGKGICIPQRAQIAQPYAACAEVDAFKGATCASAQLCAATGGETSTAVCTPVCDLGCVVTDGGAVPAGCSTRPNALCGAGKTCTKKTSTFGNRVGYCL